MLSTPAPFPHVGSFAYTDVRTPDDCYVVERVRIQQDKGNGQALVSKTDRRFRREAASDVFTVPFADLRETEQPIRIKSKPSANPSGRKPKANAARRR